MIFRCHRTGEHHSIFVRKGPGWTAHDFSGVLGCYGVARRRDNPGQLSIRRAECEKRTDQEVKRNGGVADFHLRHTRLARSHQFRQLDLGQVLLLPAFPEAVT